MGDVSKLIETCYKCPKGGPEVKLCAHCRTPQGSGVYKAHLVEALLNGYEPTPYKGGGKPGRTILTDLQVKKVTEALKNGRKVTEIAAELRVSPGVIYRLRQRGV
jgi:hypothetical protein